MVGGFLEVGTDAVAEVDGLADVDDRAVFVFVEITAGFGGEGFEFFLYGGRCHALLYRKAEDFANGGLSGEILMEEGEGGKEREELRRRSLFIFFAK